ncbi:hypothetical protein F751_6274 [Auxenochlorella protothecoides]|uniref:Uncharacterized protein n=1 Tax=Auxenochlorella protothecoides TaxID=3075 RepID=A0A087SK69_AUXPR|nr:hypothetical protein F751_6274 [Auxenochlorella protothecoides]KFM26123.1 hypothetical protein F751_6274 [Auxenochlorella protothecoides]
MRCVPPLPIPPEGPFTMADIVVACPTHKTASTEVLLSRVAWILPNLRRDLAWHMHGKPFRKLRHQAYVGRERAINRLAEQFRPPPGMTTVVGVGNWCPTHKTASTEVLLSRVAWILPNLRRDLAWHMHGKPFRKLRHQAYVGRERAINRLAEQFRPPPGMTTVVGYVRVRNGEEKLVDVWDTKRCVNKGCRVHVVNRDVNGAANMLMLTKCFLRMHLAPQLLVDPLLPLPFLLPPTPRFAI